MGCRSSKMDDSDVVLQCLRRKRLMRDAVNYRHEFAFAHLIYIETLRKVGKALYQFAEADSSNTQAPPRSPVRSSRPPPLATYVHPPRSPAAHAHSPPLKTANRPSGNPPSSTTSPTQESPTLLGPEAGAPLPTRNSSSAYGDGDMMASSPKTFDFSSPYFSPAREESDGFFMPFASSRPSVSQYDPPFPSSPQRSSWDPFNFFHSSPLTYHTSEQRKLSEEHEVEEEMTDFDKIVQEEGLPDLEEEEQEYETEQPAQNEEQYHEQESTNAHSEDRRPEPNEGSAQNSAEKVVEEQEGNLAVIVPVEKNDDVVFTMAKGKNLTEVMKFIDDQFTKVADSVKEVSGMLETQASHRHESTLDFRDSSKVLNAIYWHRPRKTATHLNGTNETNHGADFGMVDNKHALILERIYTWERKLYEEVKAGEHLRIAFDKKCKQLSILSSKGHAPDMIEKTKIAVTSLDSQLVVALRAVYSASMKIQQLTNEELYPQLTELVRGLMNMWKLMLDCHKTQRAIAMALQSLENPKAGVEASDAYRNATIELEHQIEKWQRHIHQWVSSQKKYISALLSWLKLCHAQPEKDESDGVMATSRTMVESSIYPLIKNWHRSLMHFEENTKVRNLLKKFAANLYALQIDQSELPLPKRRVETFAKDSDRRTGSLLTMGKRYREQVFSGKRNRTENQSNSIDMQQERESFLKSSKNHQEEEKHTYTQSMQPKETLSCLQENLPGIFEEMTSFAEIALREYEKLHQESESLKTQPEEQTSEE